MRPRATSVTTCRYWRAPPAHHLRTTCAPPADRRPTARDHSSRSHRQAVRGHCRPDESDIPSKSARTTLGHRSAHERLVVDGEQGRRYVVQRSMTKYDRTMTVERLTVSLESELAIAVREAADADQQNVSAWLADAARRQLANRGLRDIVAAWEHEHGAFSGDELAAARALVDG
jgi:hypothetical protein